MTVFELVDAGFRLLHSMALGLNFLTLYLISRIRLKEIDMWLGVIMTTCDILLSVYKISHISIINLVEKSSFLFDIVVNVPICAFVMFVIRWSTVSVGYLGIVRWLVICRKLQPIEFKWMTLVYFGHMFIFVFTLVLCYCFNGFRTTPDGVYYLPYWRITNSWGFLTSLMISLNFLLCFFAFNGSYILIARQYLRQLTVTISSSQLYHRRLSFQREKYLIVIKIAVMLFLYNFTVIPPLIVCLMEMITNTSRSVTSDFIFCTSITCIILVNPVVLITMHCQTWHTFRSLFSSRRTHPHHPNLTEPGSNITIDRVDLHNKSLKSHC